MLQRRILSDPNHDLVYKGILVPDEISLNADSPKLSEEASNKIFTTANHILSNYKGIANYAKIPKGGIEFFKACFLHEDTLIMSLKGLVGGNMEHTRVALENFFNRQLNIKMADSRKTYFIKTVIGYIQPKNSTEKIERHTVMCIPKYDLTPNNMVIIESLFHQVSTTLIQSNDLRNKEKELDKKQWENLQGSIDSFDFQIASSQAFEIFNDMMRYILFDLFFYQNMGFLKNLLSKRVSVDEIFKALKKFANQVGMGITEMGMRSLDRARQHWAEQFTKALYFNKVSGIVSEDQAILSVHEYLKRLIHTAKTQPDKLAPQLQKYYQDLKFIENEYSETTTVYFHGEEVSTAAVTESANMQPVSIPENRTRVSSTDPLPELEVPKAIPLSPIEQARLHYQSVASDYDTIYKIKKDSPETKKITQILRKSADTLDFALSAERYDQHQKLRDKVLELEQAAEQSAAILASISKQAKKPREESSEKTPTPKPQARQTSSHSHVNIDYAQIETLRHQTKQKKSLLKIPDLKNIMHNLHTEMSLVRNPAKSDWDESHQHHAQALIQNVSEQAYALLEQIIMDIKDASFQEPDERLEFLVELFPSLIRESSQMQRLEHFLQNAMQEISTHFGKLKPGNPIPYQPLYQLLIRVIKNNKLQRFPTSSAGFSFQA